MHFCRNFQTIPKKMLKNVPRRAYRNSFLIGSLDVRLVASVAQAIRRPWNMGSNSALVGENLSSKGKFTTGSGKFFLDFFLKFIQVFFKILTQEFYQFLSKFLLHSFCNYQKIAQRNDYKLRSIFGKNTYNFWKCF